VRGKWRTAAAGKSKEPEKGNKGRQRDAILANKAAIRNLSGHKLIET
jgi:hypothetical protein